MIAAPPLDRGMKKALNLAFNAVTDVRVGADGTVRGVAVMSADSSPEPTEFTARTCTSYVVPFVNAVEPSDDNALMSSDVAAPPLSVRGYHVAPRSVEYS